MKKLLLSCGTILLASTIMSAQTLVGHWPFNGNANDVSGNGLNGTVYGATPTTDQNGTPNSAYAFDGVSSHIDVPYNSLLDLTSWTIQASVCLTAFNPVACQEEVIVARAAQYSDETYLLASTDNNSIGNYYNDCTSYTPDKTLFQSGAAGTVSHGWNLNNFIILNHWYCVTTTYGNDTLKMYRDGVLTDSMYWPNNYAYGGSFPTLIFGHDGSANLNYFNGKIEDIAIWNGALSDSAINATCSAAHETTAVPQISAGAQSLVISPNPATTTLNVQLSNKGNAVLYVINELGQTVQSVNVHSTNNVLDVSRLSPGLYFVRAAADDGSVQVAKFMKE